MGLLLARKWRSNSLYLNMHIQIGRGRGNIREGNTIMGTHRGHNELGNQLTVFRTTINSHREALEMFLMLMLCGGHVSINVCI